MHSRGEIINITAIIINCIAMAAQIFANIVGFLYGMIGG